MTESWADDELIRDLWGQAERPRRAAPLLTPDGARCVYHGRWLSKTEGEAKVCNWCVRERGEGT